LIFPTLLIIFLLTAASPVADVLTVLASFSIFVFVKLIVEIIYVVLNECMNNETKREGQKSYTPTARPCSVSLTRDMALRTQSPCSLDLSYFRSSWRWQGCRF